MQIERESIADVHAGGCFSDQLAADIQTGHHFPLVPPASQRAGYVDTVSDLGPTAAQSLPSSHHPTKHYIADQLPGMRDIAARELCLSLVQQLIHAAIEAIDPALIRPPGERERYQAVQRTSAHGGDIAQAARDSPAPNLPGGVRTSKMHALDTEIRGE